MTVETVEHLVTIVFGGGFVSLLWGWYRDRLENYRELDEAYRGVLTMYRERPAFGDRDAADTYATSFALQKWDYHYFAMSVHNMLETLFDVLPSWKRPASDPVWSAIFVHHARLHYAWLLEHKGAFEPAYVEYVTAALGTVRLNTSPVPETLHVNSPLQLTRRDDRSPIAQAD